MLCVLFIYTEHVNNNTNFARIIEVESGGNS